MDSNLARRIGFAIAAIPVALFLVWYGGPPLALFLALAAALGTRELFGLAERRAVRPAYAIGVVSAAAIAPITYVTIAADEARSIVLASWPYAAGLWLLLLLT